LRRCGKSPLPTQSLQVLPHDALCLLFARFLSVSPVVVGTCHPVFRQASPKVESKRCRSSSSWEM
jgi:hypothetical protein